MNKYINKKTVKLNMANSKKITITADVERIVSLYNNEVLELKETELLLGQFDKKDLIEALLSINEDLEDEEEGYYNRDLEEEVQVIEPVKEIKKDTKFKPKIVEENKYEEEESDDENEDEDDLTDELDDDEEDDDDELDL